MNERTLWIDILSYYVDQLIVQRQAQHQELLLTNEGYSELKEFVEKRDKSIIEQYGSNEYPLLPQLLSDNPILPFRGFNFKIKIKKQ